MRSMAEGDSSAQERALKRSGKRASSSRSVAGAYHETACAPIPVVGELIGNLGVNEDVLAKEEVLKMLAAMQPPDTPDLVFTAEHADILACRRWHKNSAAALLGGLQTDPQFHANGVRFDWLLRLVLAKAEGRQKPTRYDLSRVLNGGFRNAHILRLEDPIEDLFCERISSEPGNFRIFSGPWEWAGPYTQTLLDAFETLPDADGSLDFGLCIAAAQRRSREPRRR